MLKNYLKIAWRNLIRNRLYSGINILGLAIGLAASLLISLYILDQYSHDRFHSNFENIYRVVETQIQADGTHPVAVTPGPLAPQLAADFSEIALSTRVGRWGYLLQSGQTGIEPKGMLIVDPAFFSLFNFKLLMGNPQKVLTRPDEIVLSETLAERFFGADWRINSPLGKVLKLNADQLLTVVGVAEDPPANSHIQFEALLPFKFVEKYDKWGNKWNSNNYHTYLLLKPETNSANFEQKITHYIEQFDPENKATLHLQPLEKIFLHSRFDFETDWGNRGDILYVRILIVVGIIILLIAAINFINLATARAVDRAREVGVRKSVGALRQSLIVQFLCESLLMTVLAVLLALLLLEFSLPLFNDLVGRQLNLPSDSALMWVCLIVFTLITGLLTGAYPALFLSAFKPARVLKGVSGISASGLSFRRVLVVGQFVISIALCIGTLVIYRQLNFMQNKKLGFDQTQLLYVKLKGETRGKAEVLKNELIQLAGVEAVSTTTATLVDITNSTTVLWEGQAEGDKFLITQANVDPDFVKTAGLTLVSGRNFSSQVPDDTLSGFGKYLINETAARRMGWTGQTALGKRINFWGLDGEVIGVVRDFHFRPMRNKIEPIIFRYRPKENYFNLLVRVHPNQLPKTLSSLKQLYKNLDQDNPLQYGFVDQEIEALYQSEKRTGRIILYFSVLAIAVSCLGLFGLVTFSVAQRTREIGIRKVLGAGVYSLVRLISADYLRLVLISNVMAVPLAYYFMQSWLEDFAYRIDLAWWYFALAGTGALIIALLTVSFQSVKAALMNPVKSLRSE